MFTEARRVLEPVVRGSVVFRKLVGKFADHTYFGRFIMFVILVNSIFLTMQKPDDSEEDYWFIVAGNVISFIFIFEMIVKLIHLGFSEYFSQKWNILDFIVVLESIFSLLFSSSINISFLRVFRVVRPLRTINRLKNLRVVVNAVFESMLGMGYILTMLGTFIFLCAMIANMLWAEILHNQCVNEATGVVLDEEINTCKLMVESQDSICDMSGYSDDGRICPTGYECKTLSTTDGYGFMNFDNIWNSMLVIFQVCTVDKWNVVMWQVQDAFSPWTSVFFILIVIVGNCAILNLFIVSIMSGFQQAMATDSVADDVIQIPVRELKSLTSFNSI